MAVILEDSSSGPVPGDRTLRSWILGKRATRASSNKSQMIKSVPPMPPLVYVSIALLCR